MKRGTLLKTSPWTLDALSEMCGHKEVQIVGRFNGDHNHDYPLQATYEKDMYFCRFNKPSDPKRTFQLVIYNKPNPLNMQYMSLAPITLEIDAGRTVDVNGVDLRGIEDKIKLLGGPQDIPHDSLQFYVNQVTNEMHHPD